MSAPVVDQVPAAVPLLVRVATVVALVAAVVGTFASGRFSSIAGGIAVGVIIATPLLRVALLGGRWARVRDTRFAVAAFGLLLVTATGAALALL